MLQANQVKVERPDTSCARALEALRLVHVRRRSGRNKVEFANSQKVRISATSSCWPSEGDLAADPVLREAHSPLVWRGALDAVDDEDLDRILGGDEPI